MAAFVVYENAQEIAYKAINRSTISNTTQTAVNLGSSLLAGFAAALVSQPADTMLSKINKTSRLPGTANPQTLQKDGVYKVSKTDNFIPIVSYASRMICRNYCGTESAEAVALRSSINLFMARRPAQDPTPRPPFQITHRDHLNHPDPPGQVAS